MAMLLGGVCEQANFHISLASKAEEVASKADLKEKMQLDFTQEKI